MNLDALGLCLFCPQLQIIMKYIIVKWLPTSVQSNIQLADIGAIYYYTRLANNGQ